jgi:hypothetical protein
MLLGAFRGGNPLERIVGNPFLWPLPPEVLQVHAMGVLRQLDVSGLDERPGEASPNPVWTIKTSGGFADHFVRDG